MLCIVTKHLHFGLSALIKHLLFILLQLLMHTFFVQLVEDDAGIYVYQWVGGSYCYITFIW